MKCPACGNELQQITVSDIEVDVCKGGCGGIWFDNFEIKKFDEKHESAGEELLNIEHNENLEIDHAQKRKCPKCDDITMMRHFYSTKKEIEIDECPQCGGFWLDEGELEKIRSLFTNEKEKDQAAHEYFSNLLDEDIAISHAQNQAQAERMRSVDGLISFLRPRSYFKGL